MNTNYYQAIVAVAQMFNNPRIGKRTVRESLSKWMSSLNQQFVDSEFNKAFAEFKNAACPRIIYGR